MDLPEIKGFLETSFVDWPGRVAATVFLPRCNFRCPYCHNHSLVLAGETLPTWPLETIFERLEEFRDWVDGVCVSGGEPTVHENIGHLLAAFQQQGWAVKLDTNGSRPHVISQLLGAGLVDAFSVDVKAPLETIPYRRNAGPGADPSAVRASLERLASSALPVEVRTTVHPDLLSREELKRLAADVARIFSEGDEKRRAPVRFTPQRCRVENTLDSRLRTRSPLEPDLFETWAREAQEVFGGTLK